MSNNFFIVYPEKRVVSSEEMLSWAKDAIANEEIEGPEDLTVEELALQLSREGLITLGLIKGSYLIAEEQDPDPVSLEAQERRAEDIREELARDPISGHHPDCTCYRCIYGDDAYIFAFHPGEY